MLTLNIAEIKQGSSQTKRTVSPVDLDLKGFNYPIEVHMDINRVADNIYIRMNFKTRISAVCDRCLEDLLQPIDENVRIVCTRDTQLSADEDDVYFIKDKSDTVDLSLSLHQALVLGIPQKLLCRPDCRGLCPSCGTNLNVKKCHCKVKKTDPRWDVLKKLKENNNIN
ncbi:DUF177 domain-containing protein [candidate division KSB1 bacterium]|nr:DUF177 domain-containing protein [candidate division KSB1 bacterium]